MREEAYESENLLQELLEKYPNLLAGDQINSISPRRWIMISREMKVPDREQGSARWFLDHLYIDQDGIPTLVEVKRSSDTRIRREVVGQMMDYAANASVYWNHDTIQNTYEELCKKNNKDPFQTLQDLVGEDADYDQFWINVHANLRKGKLRLLFIADEIPMELQRIIEFLNEQMISTEVLGVEIRQYQSETLKTLVPRVIGKTAESEQVKGKISASREERWDENSFLEELKKSVNDKSFQAGKQILEWGKKHSERIYWGVGKDYASCVPIIYRNELKQQPFNLYSHGTLEIYFYWYAYKKPFIDESLRKEMLAKLNSIEGINLPEESINKRPNINLEIFTKADNLKKLLDVFDWWLDKISE